VWARVKGFPWWPATIRREMRSNNVRNSRATLRPRARAKSARRFGGVCSVHVLVLRGNTSRSIASYLVLPLRRGWVCLKDIMDFTAGYEEFKDVRMKSAARQQWYVFIYSFFAAP
jgi:hypothetical protein